MSFSARCHVLEHCQRTLAGNNGNRTTLVLLTAWLKQKEKEIEDEIRLFSGLSIPMRPESDSCQSEVDWWHLRDVTAAGIVISSRFTFLFIDVFVIVIFYHTVDASFKCTHIFTLRVAK